MAKSKTYELLLKIGGKKDSSLKAACEAADKNLSSLGTSAKAIGKAAAAGLAVAGAAVVAGGKAMYDLGTEFDSAYDTIRIGTGATGEALTDLQDSMKTVYKSVPTEMENAAKAIADYNTRLGVTGPVLETLSKQAIKTSDMLGDDLNAVITSSSQAFQQWNVSEENMADGMDHIFKVSQSTGMGFSTLMGDLQQYGAQLQEMGYGFEDGAVLIGQMEKAGVNVPEVLGAMKKSVAAMAKEGLSATEGMSKYYNAIKNAGTATEAINIASKVFGTRAASTMSAAIRDGTLDVDGLTEALAASTETIGTAAGDTYDLAEKWQMFKNRIDVALEPVANTVFSAIGEAVEEIMPMVEEFIPAVADGIMNITNNLISAAKWVGEHKDMILAVAAGIGAAVVAYKAAKLGMAAYNAVMAIHKIVTLASAGATMTAAQAAQALNLKMLAIVGVIGLVVGAAVWLYQNWDMVKQKAAELGAKIGEIWSNISNAVNNAISAISEKFPMLGAYLQGFWDSIQAAWGNVQAIFSNIIDFIDNVFSGNWSAAWDNIVAIFGNVFGLIVNLAKAPINGVISAINWVLSKVNSISVTIPDWVPGVGGKTLGFNIPTIPQLAVGGIATKPTLAEIGEGGEPEAVLPLSKLAALMDDKKDRPDRDDPPEPQHGGGTTERQPAEGKQRGDRPTEPQHDGGQVIFSPVFNFYGPANKEEAQEEAKVSFEEFKRMWRRLQAEDRRKSFSPA